MCSLDGASFTAMARRFGISKSAVSQVFSRLSAKGVVVVSKDPSRRNAARVALTPLGEALRAQIMNLREELSRELEGRLSSYTDAELQLVSRFVADLHAFVVESLSSLSTAGGR